MMRLCLPTSADVVRLFIQIFKDRLLLASLVRLSNRLCNYEVLISLQLLTQCSHRMCLTTSVLSLYDNSKWFSWNILCLSKEEAFDLIVNFINELLISNEWVGVLSIVYFFLDDQRIIVKLQEHLWWNDLSLVSAGGTFTDCPLIERVDWLEDGDTYGLSFEFTMLAILEGNLIHSFVFSSQIYINLSSSSCLHRPIHDSCCQVNRVTKTRKLFSTSWSSNNSREDITSGDSNIAPCIVDFKKLSSHVEGNQNCSDCIIVMSHWTKTPDADECTTFIIEHQFIQTSFESVNLLLDCLDDLLDLVDTFHGAGGVQIDTERSKHDSESSGFGAVWFITNFKIRHDSGRNTLPEVFLDTSHFVHFDLGLEKNGVCSRSDTLNDLFNEVEFVSRLWDDLITFIVDILHEPECCVGYNDLSSRCCFTFWSKCKSMTCSNGEEFRPLKNTTNVEKGTFSKTNTNLIKEKILRWI